jgi:hypothetical protein
MKAQLTGGRSRKKKSTNFSKKNKKSVDRKDDLCYSILIRTLRGFSMTKKEIIARLREMGYKANYSNTYVTMLEKFGYVCIADKDGLHKVYLGDRG